MKSAHEPSTRPAESFKTSRHWLAGANQLLWWCHHHGVFTDSSNFHIKGANQVRQLEKPTIIAFNHTSLLEPIWDSFLVHNLTDDSFKIAAMDELWKYPFGSGRVTGKVIEKLGGFPVKRASDGMSDLIRIGSHVLNGAKDTPGQHLVIYPEGKRNRDERVKPKVGTAVLSAVTGAQILPAGQVGVDSHTGVYRFRGNGPVSVVFGELLDAPERTSMEEIESLERREKAELLRSWNEPIRKAMQATLDEARELHQQALGVQTPDFSSGVLPDDFPTIEPSE